MKHEYLVKTCGYVFILRKKAAWVLGSWFQRTLPWKANRIQFPWESCRLSHEVMHC